MKTKNQTLKNIERGLVSLWCDGFITATEKEQILSAMLNRGVMNEKRVERLRVSLNNVSR